MKLQVRDLVIILLLLVILFLVLNDNKSNLETFYDLQLKKLPSGAMSSVVGSGHNSATMVVSPDKKTITISPHNTKDDPRVYTRKDGKAFSSDQLGSEKGHCSFWCQGGTAYCTSCDWGAPPCVACGS